MLGEETLKILVALICIIFLIYFLTSIYFAKLNETKRIEATNVIERIYEIARDLQTSESNYTIPNPSGWYLFSFTETKKPNACATENCMCVCSKIMNIPLLDNSERQIKECDKKGACQIVSNLNKFEAVKIGPSSDLTTIIINKQNGVSITKK